MATRRVRHRLAGTVWLAVALTASTASAQQPPPDINALTSALAVERARMTALQAELERQALVLADLTRRLEAMASAQPAPSLSVPEPTPAAPSRFGFYGESKVRYETLQQAFPDCVGCPNRKRGRLRLRFGAEGRLSPDFTGVLGFGVGEVNDPNTVYVNLGSNFSRKVATWDRGYVEFHPTRARWMKLTAGKFPYTWNRSSMTFDVDFYPEGVSERLSFDLGHAGPLKNVGIQGFQLIESEQPLDRHMTIVGTQLTARVQTAPRVSTLLTATGVGIQNPNFLLRALLDGTDVGVRNTNATAATDGVPAYTSGFRYANVIVENAIRTAWDRLPVTVGLEYQRNLRAASNRDTGLSFRLDAGRVQQRGDWNFGWHMFRVEQDAILAGLGESDWRAPSNVLQHRFAIDRMVHSNVQLSYTWYRGRTLDSTLPGALLAPSLPSSRRDPWMNRMYFDVTYRY